VDRGKPGSKIHALTERDAIPLAVLIAANRNDHLLLDELLDAVAPVRQLVGRPRKRPGKLHADKGHDHRRCRRSLRRRGIRARIARKGIESSTQLGRRRYVIERALQWITRFWRLARRYDRIGAHFETFARLACRLQKPAGIVKRFNRHAVLVLPVSIALRGVPRLKPRQRVRLMGCQRPSGSRRWWPVNVPTFGQVRSWSAS
jgi:hypothetical protein